MTPGGQFPVKHSAQVRQGAHEPGNESREPPEHLNATRAESLDVHATRTHVSRTRTSGQRCDVPASQIPGNRDMARLAAGGRARHPASPTHSPNCSDGPLCPAERAITFREQPARQAPAASVRSPHSLTFGRPRRSGPGVPRHLPSSVASRAPGQAQSTSGQRRGAPRHKAPVARRVRPGGTELVIGVSQRHCPAESRSAIALAGRPSTGRRAARLSRPNSGVPVDQIAGLPAQCPNTAHTRPAAATAVPSPSEARRASVL